MFCKMFFVVTLTVTNLLISTTLYAQAKEVNFGVVIDFLDTAYYSKKGDHFSKEELRERMRKLSDAGIRKFYFRAAPGVAYYPSKVLKMFSGDGRNEIWDKRLITSINNYDVLNEYVKVCKEFGIKIYYWEPIFDNEITPVHYPPESEKGGKYGEYPLSDIFFTNNKELYMKHRYADRFGGRVMLKRPINMIKLISTMNKKPRLTKNDIIIYVGNKKDDPPLVPYEKDFTFTIEKTNGKYAIVLGKLDIKSEIIKIKQKFKDTKYTFILDLDRKGWCDLYDSQGKLENMMVTGEVTSCEDINPCNTISGTGPVRAAWDYKGISVIIHIGYFEKYAGGMPCYALRESRNRRIAIAKEILTNYPDIDGIAYSLRSHSKVYGYKSDFGFNKIIVDEYKKRYNVNILTQGFDHEKFMSLRGDLFTEFVGEMGKLVHSYGKEFEVQAVPDSNQISYGLNDTWRGYSINNFFQIKKWAQKGYVDTVMILSGNKSWSPKWENQIRVFHDRLKGTKTKLSFMFLIRGGKSLPFIQKVAENRFIDEVILYEEEDVYSNNMYDAILSSIKKANEIRLKKSNKK